MMEKETVLHPGMGKGHSLHLEERRSVALTGVEEVLAFDESQVVLRTGSGEVALMGEGLHVTRLMMEEGQLTVEGKIDSFFYSSPRKGRRLFGKNK